MAFGRREALALFLLALARSAASGSPASSASETTDTDASKESGQPAPKLTATTKIKDCCAYPLAAPGTFRLTFYWIASQEQHVTEQPVLDVYDPNGIYLGTYPKTFVDDLKMEGTGVLMDGRVLNWAGKCKMGAGACFVILDPTIFPEGRGAGERQLEQYKSIAVDPSMIPLGDAVYIPELDGIVLPDGSVHDGCVRADDVGFLIKKKHIDFFVASADGYRTIAQQLAGHEVATPEVAAPRCQYLATTDPHTVY